MTRLLKYFKNYKLTSILGPFFKLLEAVFELIIPLVVKSIIDNGILTGDKTYCIKMCLVLVLLGFAGFLFSIIAQYFAAKSAVGFAANVRMALFEHIHSLSFSDIDKLGTGTLITRLTSDINQVQNGVNMALRLFLRSPFIVFGAMIMAFTQDVKAAMLFVIVIPVLLVIVFSIIIYTIPKYKQVQSRVDKVLSLTRENVNGVRVIRAFCNEDNEEAKFNKANDSLTELQFKVGRVSALLNPVTYVVINVAIMVLIYTCGVRVNLGNMSAGETVALYNYMSQILVELVKLANLIITITKALACANRVADVLAVTPSMLAGDNEPEVIKEGLKPVVEFENVSIAYNEGAKESLADVSFKVYPGETVGVIGGTGCGKTTLVHLIPRFYDATEGNVKVFGKNVKELDTKLLRNKIGIVMQKAVLFKGDIRSNMNFAKGEADTEEMKDALKRAQASAFLELDKSGKGLERSVEQGGNNLSGGQRQRISIARALVKKPEILILDDSASALDYATDAALRKAIKELSYKPTTFIVSQRASTVRYSDKIIVLDDGKVSGIGTHDELLANNKIYQEIYNSQVTAG